MQLTKLLEFLKKKMKDTDKKYDFIVVCCVINDIIICQVLLKNLKKLFVV